MNKSDYDKIALALHKIKPSRPMYEDSDWVCGIAEGRVEAWEETVSCLTYEFAHNDNFDPAGRQRFIKIANDGTLLALRS